MRRGKICRVVALHPTLKSILSQLPFSKLDPKPQIFIVFLAYDLDSSSDHGNTYMYLRESESYRFISYPYKIVLMDVHLVSVKQKYRYVGNITELGSTIHIE